MKRTIKLKIEEVDLELVKLIQARAVYLLAMREYGSKELNVKLLQKFDYAQSENLPFLVDFVISECQENNYLSDERFIESYVRVAIEKGQGPYKIKQELQLKTAELDLVNAYLDLDESDWIDVASSVLEKKYGDTRKPKQIKEQAKRVRFLQSRGFSQNQIWKAFRV